MAKIIDNAIALRILYLLVLPFYKWQAYKEGIIDDVGTIIQQGVQSDNWTMLHRLVARLKILLGKIPGGKSPIATAAAAYLLVKESIDTVEESKSLEEVFIAIKDYKIDDNLIEEVTYFYSILLEDGESVPANNISNVAGIKPGDEPPGPSKPKKKILKRKIEAIS